MQNTIELKSPERDSYTPSQKIGTFIGLLFLLPFILVIALS